MKTGILLTNLGTPDSPTEQDLRKYLSEFLSDPRVVDPSNFFQKIVWKIVLNGIILRKRPKKSAENYAKIWDSFGPGSPLLNITNNQLEGVKTTLSKRFNNLEFAVGMRYGNPSIASALQELKVKNCSKIIILPLYPQNSGPTTLSSIDAINKETSSWKDDIDIVVIDQYHQHDDYIQALAQSVAIHQKEHGKPDQLIMSFHGMPQRYVDNGDVYYDQCLKTAQLLSERLNLTQSEYKVSFQSVFGKEEWIKPYTDATLKSLAKDGVEHVQVICPGFSADCLETIEEIDQENRAYFLESGGKTFSYIPALNATDSHIHMISELIAKHLE